jgi:Apea-like HEPN
MAKGARTPRQFKNRRQLVDAIASGSIPGAVNALEACGELAGIKFVYLPSDLDGFFFKYTDLAERLVRQSSTCGADKAVAGAERTLLDRTISCRRVLAVRGLIVEEKLHSGGVDVLPYKDLDASWHPYAGYGLETEPQTAVIIPSESSVDLDPTDEQTALWTYIGKVNEEIDGVLNRLSVVTGGASACMMSWHIHTDEYPWNPGRPGCYRGDPRPNAAQPRLLTQRALDRAVAFRENETRAARFAVNSYRSAMATLRFEDAALDIGVAFESLLLRANTAELKFRLALRAAYLIGGNDPGERLRIFGLIKRTYDTRCTLAHSGHAGGKGEIQLRDETAEALAIFPKAAEIILATGFPSEERWLEIVLGAAR